MSEYAPMTELPLFAAVEPKARNSDPDTSHAAAASMSETAVSQRLEIYRYLLRFGPLTADTLDQALGMRVTSAGRRLPELQALGLVVMLEEKGMTRSGRSAHLWRAI